MPLLVSDLSQWSGRAVAAISTMRKGRAGVHGFYEPHPFFVSACVIRPIRRPVEGVADSTYPAVLVIKFGIEYLCICQQLQPTAQ